MHEERIKLGHGSGGVLTRRLIKDTLLRFFDSPRLADLPDSALVEMAGERVAFTTDSYVVDPIFFPGGDIGKLAVFGTVNDLAVVGSVPRFLSCALLLEEGLPTADLERVLESIRIAADAVEIEVITGDTKVLPRGKADRMFINTAGLGTVPEGVKPPGGEPRPGDAVIVSGPVGDHGGAVLAQREGLDLEASVVSDCAPLTDLAQAVLGAAGRMSFMRDLTRGGLATVLNELAKDAGAGIMLDEELIPVREEVRSICELLGLDPLYLACEGRLVAVVEPDAEQEVLEAMRGLPHGEASRRIGRVCDDYVGRVVLRTRLGTHRLLQMLSGEQLPRIC